MYIKLKIKLGVNHFRTYRFFYRLLQHLYTDEVNYSAGPKLCTQVRAWGPMALRSLRDESADENCSVPQRTSPTSSAPRSMSCGTALARTSPTRVTCPPTWRSTSRSRRADSRRRSRRGGYSACHYQVGANDSGGERSL